MIRKLACLFVLFSATAFCTLVPTYQVSSIEGPKNSLHIGLVDGSMWSVDKRFQNRVVASWAEGDKVTVFPLASPWYLPFSTPSFAFLNPQRKNLVIVKLAAGPKDYKRYAAYVTKVLPRHYDAIVEIGLNNGQRNRFLVPRAHKSELSQWKKGDPILYGSNMTPEGQDVYQDSLIIINTRRNSYVTAEMRDELRRN